MTDYVIEDETEESSSCGDQREEWYVSDLQLAAELGKTLLERNNDLEVNLKQQQAVIEEQAQEIQFLSRQAAALKEVNDSRLRIYEQLEVSVSDLEKTNQKLLAESSNDKKRIKSLCSSIDLLETKCEELQKLVDDLKTAERLKKRERHRTVLPLLDPPWPAETLRRRFSIENGATVALDTSEDFEVAKLRASVSTLKSQLSKEERKSVDLEAQINVLMLDNSNLQEQVQLLQEQQERLAFYHQAERLYWACHKCRIGGGGGNIGIGTDQTGQESHSETPESSLEREVESEDTNGQVSINSGQCTLVELKNGAMAYGSQESLRSVGIIETGVGGIGVGGVGGGLNSSAKISQRNCISLLSELDAQYRAVIEKYEELLRVRRNSSHGDSDTEELTSMDHTGHLQAVRSLSEELSDASDLSLSSGFSESSDRSLIDQGVQTETPKLIHPSYHQHNNHNFPNHTATATERTSPVSSHFHHSPPEYQALFHEIFSVLKRSAPTPSINSSLIGQDDSTIADDENDDVTVDCAKKIKEVENAKLDSSALQGQQQTVLSEVEGRCKSVATDSATNKATANTIIPQQQEISALRKTSRNVRKFYQQRHNHLQKQQMTFPNFLCSSTPSLLGFPVIRLPGCMSYAEVLTTGGKMGRPLFVQKGAKFHQASPR